MRIVCIGGGPAGLTFALLMKKLDPGHDITVVERNRPYDTFGWGVVFSDATMAHLRRWDEETAGAIEAAFAHWDDIVLEFKGRSDPLGRPRLRRHRPQAAAQHPAGALRVAGREARVRPRGARRRRVPRRRPVVASDGVNSVVRQKYADVFQPDIVTRPNRFIWLGTKKLYDAFTFVFERTEHGWFQAHVYKFDARDVDLHRRMPGARLARARPRQARRRRVGRVLRAGVRAPPAGRDADDQRAPPARLGVAQLPAHQVRAVVGRRRPPREPATRRSC